jgi:hypothetical protein
VISAIYGMNLGYALHSFFGGEPVSADKAIGEITTILARGIGG